MTVTHKAPSQPARDDPEALFPEARRRRRRIRLTIGAILIVVAATAVGVFYDMGGHGAPPTGPPPSPVKGQPNGAIGTGTVDGVLEITTGHVVYGPHRLPGTVVFTDSQGSRTSVKVAANGAFSVDLAPGTYVAVGHSPNILVVGPDLERRERACHSLKPVSVQSGITVSVTIAC